MLRTFRTAEDYLADGFRSIHAKWSFGFPEDYEPSDISLVIEEGI
jgi:hypothetical protein